MITFFRHVRRGLLNDNRLAKYLLYAAGEILLVVVGILMALQINNWNTQQTKSSEELEILKSCQKGLVVDLLDINYNITVHESAIISTEMLIEMLENEGSYHDSLDYHFGQLMIFTRFVHSTSAFETLKAKGVNLISNDTLRDQIIEVFDSRYNFFLSNEQSFIEHLDYGVQHIMNTRFNEAYLINIEEVASWMKPLDFDALKRDQEFLFFLKTTKNLNVLMVEFHYSQLKSVVTRLNDALQAEIASFDKD